MFIANSVPIHPYTEAPASATTPPNPPSRTSTGQENEPALRSPESERRTSSGLNPRSCVTCRRRKVKCDKLEPCSNCTRAHTECVFPAPGRAPRRRPRPGEKLNGAGGKGFTEREKELLKRLRRLEGVVGELSGHPEGEAGKPSPDSSTSSHKDGESMSVTSEVRSERRDREKDKVRVIGMDEGRGTRKDWITRNFSLGLGPPKTAFDLEKGFGRLAVDEGKSQYVSNPYWAHIHEEVSQIREILDGNGFDSDSDTPILPTDAITDSSHQTFLMGYSSSEVNLKALHPLPSQIPFYWQKFCENVNPLVKLLHIPTMDKVIKEIQGNLSSLGKSTEALMFAIYYATITSMTHDEVMTDLGVEKSHLLAQYRFGCEQALARAGFLNTEEIVTVQAFVLFLVCVRRHDDTRFVWSLTGLAIRLGQSLGLHRDGTKFGLSPFDTEMRRRLWWQLCILDVRSAEDHGADPSIMDQSFDTEMPLNVDDDDLYPDATEFPTPRIGTSEMTFCLIRYEVCQLTRDIVGSSPGVPINPELVKYKTPEEKEQHVRDCSTRLETQYLQYCENAGPLFWVSATVARLITAKMSLIIYHSCIQPGRPNDLSQPVKDRLFMCAVEILEYSRVLESEAKTRQWGWLFHTYTQWHAIAFLLGELSVRSNSTTVNRAWRAVDSVFTSWGSAVAQSGKNNNSMLWMPMRKLMAKARHKREENMRLNDPNPGLGMDPAIIIPEPTGVDSKPVGCPKLRAAQLAAEAAGSVWDGKVAASELSSPGSNTHSGQASLVPFSVDMDMMRPLTPGLDMLQADSQDPMQVHAQTMQQVTPWIMQDDALLDLDMNALDGDVSWEGWDDLVRDYQLSTEDGALRGPTMSGIGSWW